MPFLEEQSQSFFSIEDICKAFSTIEALFKTSYPDSPTFERLFQGLLFNVRPFESLFSFGRPFKVVTLSKISIPRSSILHRKPFLDLFRRPIKALLFYRRHLQGFLFGRRPFQILPIFQSQIFLLQERVRKLFLAKRALRMFYTQTYSSIKDLYKIFSSIKYLSSFFSAIKVFRGALLLKNSIQRFSFPKKEFSKILSTMKVLSKASHLLKKSQSPILQNIFRWYYLLQKIFDGLLYFSIPPPQ